MMSLRRLFGLMLLFLLFEATVAVVTAVWWSDANPLLVCAAMTGIAILVWMCVFTATRLLSRRAAAAPAVDVQRPAPVAKKTAVPEDAFVTEVRGLKMEAERRLGGLLPARPDGKAAMLSDVPILLVLGPEGAGKTTAVLQSGLEPRLLAGETAREGATPPTKLANFWLAEGTLFVEISGRMLMQEPDRYEQVLRILREERKLPSWRQWRSRVSAEPNVRGVVLACDTQMFLRASELPRIAPLARTLKERLQTANAIFGKDLPVYVLLTRVDGVPYFSEFFGQLSEIEARRPLGATLPLSRASEEGLNAYEDREGRRLAQFFNRLHQALADKRMMLLAREEDAHKRALGFEFPRELKKIRAEVVQFLLDVFRPATLEPGYQLRGFYFTGRQMIRRGHANMEMSTSAGPALSVLRRPAEATAYFGGDQAILPDQSVVQRNGAKEARWTFLPELFREIILRDPAGNALPVRTRTRERTVLEAAMATVGVLCLILALFWTNSWRSNEELLDRAEGALGALHPVSTDGPEAVSDLEAMRPVMADLHADKLRGASWRMRWGLYTGEPVRLVMDGVYFPRFRTALLGPVLAAMRDRMNALQPDTPAGEDVTGLEKSYRAMTSRACAPEDSVMRSTVMPVWRSVAMPDPSVARLAQNQFDFYLAELKIADPYAAMGTPLPESHDAVMHAQSYLQGMGGPDKLMRAVVEQVDRQTSEDKLSEYAGNYGEVMSGPNALEGAYTAQGWMAVHEGFRDHSKIAGGDPCVVGSNSDLHVMSGSGSAANREVERLYRDTYMQQWKEFLAAHHVMPFSGPLDGAQKLRVLADNNRSPLLALVYMTSVNTNVQEPQSVGDRVSGTVRMAAQGTQSAIKQMVQKFSGGKPGEARQANAVAVQEVPDTVVNEFEPVHAMVDPATRDKWLNEKNQAYMKSLEEMSAALGALPARIDSTSPPDMQALAQANTSVANATMALHTMEGSFHNTRLGVDVELKALLEEPLRYASATVHAVPIVKPAPAPIGVAGGAAPPPPPGPSPHDLARPTIEQVNRLSRDLCAAEATLQNRYPFDATATQEIGLDDLDGLLGASGNAAYTHFALSPEVSKAYAHQGKVWEAKPDFPATFSQPFLFELNNLGPISEALYGEGSAHAHVEYTVTLDGTGKIPFELDVDGHVLKYTPGKPAQPVHLVWPPLTNAPTRLVAHTGSKNALTLPAQNAGPWSLHRLLQAADDQSGNTFTFRTVGFAHSLVPLTNEKGTPGTLQIRVESPAGNIFSRGYFAKLRCEGAWAVN